MPGSVILRSSRLRMSDSRRKLLQYLSAHPAATLKNAADALRCSLSNVKKIAAQLQREGLLCREGNHRSGLWRATAGEAH